PLPPSDIVISEANLDKHLGNTAMYGAYLKFFDEIVHREGIDRTLATYFPRLLPGLIGGLTHPWIHIGYGLEFRNPGVVAEGFAYACSWFVDQSFITDHVLCEPHDKPGPEIEPNNGAKGGDKDMGSGNLPRHPSPPRAKAKVRELADPWHVMLDVETNPLFQIDSTNERFAQRQQDLMARPAALQYLRTTIGACYPWTPDHFHSPTDRGHDPAAIESTTTAAAAIATATATTVSDVERGPIDSHLNRQLADLVPLVTCVFAEQVRSDQRLDFYLAHGVTSLFATHIIWPYLTDPYDRVRLLRLQLFGVAVIYVCQGRGRLVPPADPTTPKAETKGPEKTTTTAAAWAKVQHECLSTDDDHVAKVVRALAYFGQVYGDPTGRYWRAARATVDRIHTTDDWITKPIPPP
ncbi:hypothetical protein H4R33_007148, partial [Dimargaris cristalligena]